MKMTTTRYFRDGDTYWKFEPGTRPKRKTGFHSHWEDSFFGNIVEFLRHPGGVVEVASEDAEAMINAPSAR